MAIVRSKLTARGQISVPVEVRRRLGIGPGAVLERDEADNQMVVRRAGRYSSEDIRQALPLMESRLATTARFVGRSRG